MNKIEEFWDDVTVYHIGFTIVREDTIGTCHKAIALKGGLYKKEINELVKTYLTILLK